MKLKIIDVSHHQGVIEWSKIKADGAMIRVGTGRWANGGELDRQFKNNIKGALSAPKGKLILQLSKRC